MRTEMSPKDFSKLKMNATVELVRKADANSVCADYSSTSPLFFTLGIGGARRGVKSGGGGGGGRRSTPAPGE